MRVIIESAGAEDRLRVFVEEAKGGLKVYLAREAAVRLDGLEHVLDLIGIPVGDAGIELSDRPDPAGDSVRSMDSPG